MFKHSPYENDYISDENEFELPILTQILHQYVEESISDEQVQRILKPIFEKIDAGEFKKGYNPRRLGGTPFVRERGNELTRQSYKFQLASPHSSKGSKKHEASLDIIWKGTELHIRIEYK